MAQNPLRSGQEPFLGAKDAVHHDRQSADQDVSPEVAQLYEQLLQDYRENRRELPIANRYPWHCKRAVEHLAKFANTLLQERHGSGPAEGQETTTISILTGGCPDEVYGSEPVLREMRTFLENGGRLQVLVWNDDISVETCRMFRHLGPSDVAEFRISGTKELGSEIQHFTVVDAVAYRLEAAHPYYPPAGFRARYPVIPARICFNDPKVGGQLRKFFDGVWAVCQPVSIRSSEASACPA